MAKPRKPSEPEPRITIFSGTGTGKSTAFLLLDAETRRKLLGEEAVVGEGRTMQALQTADASAVIAFQPVKETTAEAKKFKDNLDQTLAVSAARLGGGESPRPVE